MAALPEDMRLEFDSLVTAERPGLVRYFHHAVRDAGLAEDLTQETFLRAARGWATFRGDCAPRTWLHRIAANVLRDQWRSRASREAAETQPWHPEDDRRLADRQETSALAVERRQVWACLGGLVAQLPSGEREAIIFAVQDALPPREVARSLGLTTEATRARLHRARRKLADMVAERCTLVADEGGALSCESRALHASSVIRPPDRTPPA